MSITTEFVYSGYWRVFGHTNRWSQPRQLGRLERNDATSVWVLYANTGPELGRAPTLYAARKLARGFDWSFTP